MQLRRNTLAHTTGTPREFRPTNSRFPAPHLRTRLIVRARERRARKKKARLVVKNSGEEEEEEEEDEDEEDEEE